MKTASAPKRRPPVNPRPRPADPWAKRFTVRIRRRVGTEHKAFTTLAAAEVACKRIAKEVGVREVYITRTNEWPSRDRLVIKRGKYMRKTGKWRWLAGAG